MTLREKIIVVAAGCMLLYGAYELGLKNLFSGTGVEEVQQEQNQMAKEIAAFTTKIAVQAGGTNLSPRERYIVDHRDSRWDKDPFVSAETVTAMRNPESAATTQKGQQFTYSGYIAIGNVKLAVINGREYKEGEQLINGGYVLRRIQPTRAVLSDRGREIIVKLQETEVKVEH